MALILIGIVALLTSGLILFSGFGLGTILMPVFALFFPVPLGERYPVSSARCAGDVIGRSRAGIRSGLVSQAI